MFLANAAREKERERREKGREKRIVRAETMQRIVRNIISCFVSTAALHYKFPRQPAYNPLSLAFRDCSIIAHIFLSFILRKLIEK